MNDFKTVIYTIYNYLKTVICNFSKLALPTQQAFLLALWLYYNTLQFFCQNAEKFKFFSKIGGILNCFLPFFRIPGCWVVFLDTDCKTNHPNTQKQILLKLTHFHHKTHPTLKAPHPYPLIHNAYPQIDNPQPFPILIPFTKNRPKTPPPGNKLSDQPNKTLPISLLTRATFKLSPLATT